MGDGKVGIIHLSYGIGGGTSGEYHNFCIFCSDFVLFLITLS